MMAQYLAIKAPNPKFSPVLPDGRFLRIVLRGRRNRRRALGIVLTKRGKHRGRHPHVRRAGRAGRGISEPLIG